MELLESLIPIHYDFIFTTGHVEVISGKQEGVYAWIAINYAMKKLTHAQPEVKVEGNIEIVLSAMDY